MKMLIKTGICLCTCLLISLNSCDVEPELTDSYSDETAWKSEKNLELYINGFYPLVGGYGGGVSLDAAADILKMNAPTANENQIALGSVSITPDNDPIGCWSWAYSWIRNCNEFLDGLNKNKNNLSEEIVNQAEGQIRFFRAYVYFCLARDYGGSVILLKELPAEKYHSRCLPNECWDFIAGELDFCASVLPTEWPLEKRGKLTKGAALGMKAKAMLHAQRWKESSDAAKGVIDLGIYKLCDNYADIFKYRRSDGRVNPESIIEFGYIYPDLGYSFDYFYCPPGDKGYAEVSPTENLVSSYQMKDGSDFSWDNPQQASNPYDGREDRFYATILYNGAQWKGRTIESFEGGVDGYAVGGGSTCTGYYMRKLFDETIDSQKEGFPKGELTHYFMRYAEVLLIYAEAMAEQDNLSEALRALNQIRHRAGFSSEKDLQAESKSQFRELLHHERMIELAFEGHRFWDLRRWNLAQQVLNGTNCTGTKITKASEGSFTYEQVDCDNGKTRVYLPKYNRFPIPSSEIQRNPECEQFDEWK